MVARQGPRAAWVRPLTVRRAGAFEKSCLLATAAVGVVGAFSGVQISGSLGAVLGATSALYFGATMILPGTLGFWSVRHSQRIRTPRQIETECRAEAIALAGVGVGWLGFFAAAAAAGFKAIAVTILIGAVPVACAWRVVEIRRDLKKLHAALEAGPRLADPPPIAEGP